MSWFASDAPEKGAAPRTETGSESSAVRVDALIAQLSSNDGEERSRARADLVKLGKPAVAALLAMLADHANHTRRWEAAKALSEIADPVTAPALVATLEDSSFDIRWLAAEGLIALERAALPSLLQALKAHSESVWLRQGAHHILCTLSDPATQSLLAPVCAALEGIESDLTIPPAAQKALQELGTIEDA
jgi:HEAT repeat protein